MIGLLIAIALFNFIAFFKHHHLTKNQIVHLWMFTIASQVLVDGYLSKKFHAYWYFSGHLEWGAFLILTVLIPPVNLIFLNGYPFSSQLSKRLLYIFYWTIAITLYECIALLPEPWGYFHYGWWTTWYSLIINPFLLYIVVKYYQWIRKIEHES